MVTFVFVRLPFVDFPLKLCDKKKDDDRPKYTALAYHADCVSIEDDYCRHEYSVTTSRPPIPVKGAFKESEIMVHAEHDSVRWE